MDALSLSRVLLLIRLSIGKLPTLNSLSLTALTFLVRPESSFRRDTLLVLGDRFEGFIDVKPLL